MCTVVHFLEIQVHVLSRRNSFDGEIGSSEEVCHDRGNCREYVYKGCMRKVCSYSIMEVNRTSLNSLFIVLQSSLSFVDYKCNSHV